MDKNYEIKIGKETFTLVLRMPKFEEVAYGFSQLQAKQTHLDMIGGGKAIFDTCKVSCAKEIEFNPQIMLRLCLQLAEEYIMPVEETFKKK
jgi:hypothetical protein